MTALLQVKLADLGLYRARQLVLTGSDVAKEPIRNKTKNHPHALTTIKEINLLFLLYKVHELYSIKPPVNLIPEVAQLVEQRTEASSQIASLNPTRRIKEFFVHLHLFKHRF